MFPPLEGLPALAQGPGTRKMTVGRSPPSRGWEAPTNFAQPWEVVYFASLFSQHLSLSRFRAAVVVRWSTIAAFVLLAGTPSRPHQTAVASVWGPLAGRTGACSRVPDGLNGLRYPSADVYECPVGPATQLPMKQLPSHQPVRAVQPKIVQASPDCGPWGRWGGMRYVARIKRVRPMRGARRRCRSGRGVCLTLPPVLPRPTRRRHPGGACTGLRRVGDVVPAPGGPPLPLRRAQEPAK